MGKAVEFILQRRLAMFKKKVIRNEKVARYLNCVSASISESLQCIFLVTSAPSLLIFGPNLKRTSPDVWHGSCVFTVGVGSTAHFRNIFQYVHPEQSTAS